MSAHPKVLAKEVLRRIGLPASWPNINVVAAAIEAVAGSNAPMEEAVEVLVKCAEEQSYAPEYNFPSEWEKREIFRCNSVDRFWFEDARWTVKDAYAEFRADRRVA